MDVVVARPPFVFCSPNLYFSRSPGGGLDDAISLKVRASVELLTQPLWLPEIDRFSDYRVVQDIKRINAGLGW